MAVYWFHPLVWAAYILLCRDIELACDERVIREIGDGCKKAYSEALLSCAVNDRAAAAYPVAFGEIGVKKRVKNILHYKKPKFWVSFAAASVCAAVIICFATEAKSSHIEEPEEKGHTLKTLTAEDVQLLAAKHGALDIEDFSPYMDLSPLEDNGSLNELLEFSYNGKAMCMRINASDKEFALAPYEDVLDHAVVFRADFLDLMEEYGYDGSCADIRSGNVGHILDGTVEMDDYMTVRLPNGLTQSGFKYWLGSHGGVYFLKEGEEETATLENAGLFAEKPSVGGIEIWESGEVVRSTQLIQELGSVQLGEVSLKRGIFQTEQGMDWYIAYTECKDSHISYCIYLNRAEYTKEEFIELSGSVRLQDHAIY